MCTKIIAKFRTRCGAKNIFSDQILGNILKSCAVNPQQDYNWLWNPTPAPDRDVSETCLNNYFSPRGESPSGVRHGAALSVAARRWNNIPGIEQQECPPTAVPLRGVIIILISDKSHQLRGEDKRVRYLLVRLSKLMRLRVTTLGKVVDWKLVRLPIMTGKIF